MRIEKDKKYSLFLRNSISICEVKSGSKNIVVFLFSPSHKSLLFLRNGMNQKLRSCMQVTLRIYLYLMCISYICPAFLHGLHVFFLLAFLFRKHLKKACVYIRGLHGTLLGVVFISQNFFGVFIWFYLAMMLDVWEVDQILRVFFSLSISLGSKTVYSSSA